MENDGLNSTEINENPAACCARGEHLPILDEQIGIVCKYCAAVILDIKYVLPPFVSDFKLPIQLLILKNTYVLYF